MIFGMAEADAADLKECAIRPWPESVFVHPCAQIDNGVTLGERSRVWQFASVIRKTKIGEDCSIASCATVDGARLGNRCIVSHGAFINPGMEIGHDVFIGPHVSLCNDFWPRADKEGWFSINELTSGNVVVTKINDGASVGANAVLMPGITIGSWAMIAAGAVVTRNVPAGHLYRRDGYIKPIDPERTIQRKRTAA